MGILICDLCGADAGDDPYHATIDGDGHVHICHDCFDPKQHDVGVLAQQRDELLSELRREVERRWEGNRRAAQEYVEDMRTVLREAAQVCKDLDDEALAKDGRLACGAECAAAIADLAVRWNVPFEEHKHDRQS